MIVKEYMILAADGMHARPAATLIRIARGFTSSLQIRKEEKLIQLNSLLGLLGLTLKYGDTISVLVDGEDEEEAVRAIDRFFNMELKNL